MDKTLHALRLLRETGPLGVSELGDQLGVARSTAHRILGTLLHHGFVEQDRVSRTYRLGPFFTRDGVESAAVARLRDAAMPFLRALSAELDETVQLAVLEGPSCRFVDGVSGHRPLRTSVQAGFTVPAYATASGKLLLAELDDAAVRALYARSRLPSVTGHTLPTIETLLDQLAVIRRDGHALNHGETEEGVGAIAVPVRDGRHRALGAVALSLPTVRMVPGSNRTMVSRLLALAAAVEAAISTEEDVDAR